MDASMHQGAHAPRSPDRIASRADYDRVRTAFRWERPEFFNFGRDVIDRWAHERPAAPALKIVEDARIVERSFGELARNSNRIASGLAALGLSPGERVIFILPRRVEWWEGLIGLLKAGLVALPGTVLLTAKDLHYRIDAGEAVAAIVDAEGAERIDQLGAVADRLRVKIVVDGPARPGWLTLADLQQQGSDDHAAVNTRADDPAIVFFTSGTTGMPKMVLHTQASYGIGHVVTGRYWLDLGPDDLHWNLADTGWAKSAWSSVFGPWICGACVFAHHTTGKFAAADILAQLRVYPITTLCAAPTIYRMLVQENLSGFQASALRTCVAAGEPLNPEVIEVWRRATGLTIRDGYGQTETVLICGNFPGVPVREGSMGLPSPGFDLAVIDAEGQRAPTDEEGDVAIRIDPERPVGMFAEYWHDPAAMSHSFRDGWYTTGDRAYIDADGYFWFVGRADDVITSAAYRIGPFEVESALITHPAVAEAAVVGSPDPIRGEIVKAFVVLAAGHAPSEALARELQEHVKQTTAPYKYPREVEFVRELPKTTSGKIRRVELRRQERERKKFEV
ncbi:MAG TPA: AMP-binding protein [Planctomycetaceae bacterium]|nr:AMP-binding protein [Planctomycetaceae bacterium]